MLHSAGTELVDRIQRLREGWWGVATSWGDLQRVGREVATTSWGGIVTYFGWRVTSWQRESGSEFRSRRFRPGVHSHHVLPEWFEDETNCRCKDLWTENWEEEVNWTPVIEKLDVFYDRVRNERPRELSEPFLVPHEVVLRTVSGAVIGTSENDVAGNGIVDCDSRMTVDSLISWAMRSATERLQAARIDVAVELLQRHGVGAKRTHNDTIFSETEAERYCGPLNICAQYTDKYGHLSFPASLQFEMRYDPFPYLPDRYSLGLHLWVNKVETNPDGSAGETFHAWQMCHFRAPGLGLVNRQDMNSSGPMSVPCRKSGAQDLVLFLSSADFTGSRHGGFLQFHSSADRDAVFDFISDASALLLDVTKLDEFTKVAVKRNPDAFEASHTILLAPRECLRLVLDQGADSRALSLGDNLIDTVDFVTDEAYRSYHGFDRDDGRGDRLRYEIFVCMERAGSSEDGDGVVSGEEQDMAVE